LAALENSSMARKASGVSGLGIGPAPRGCAEQSQSLRFSTLSADAGSARTEANVSAITASGAYGMVLVPAPSPSGVSVIGAAGISATSWRGIDWGRAAAQPAMAKAAKV